MNEVTMFADYRVPQILLHLGVLEYSPSLLNKIKLKEEIPFGSEEENEIRAGYNQLYYILITDIC